MREAPVAEFPPFSSSFREEELSRLLEVVSEALGANTWTPGVDRQLASLRRGFSWLVESRPAAAKWREAIGALMQRKTVAAASEPRRVTALAVLLEQQPRSMPTAQTNNCLGLAALAFAEAACGLESTNAFIANLGQLFKSPRPHWDKARASLGLDVTSPIAAPEGAPLAVVQFLRSAEGLLGRPLRFPDLCEPSQDDESVFAPTGIAAAIQALPAKQPRKIVAFDREPCYFLQEFQIVQQEHEPALNNYLLENDWNSLTSAEHDDCCRILVQLMREPGEEAAARARRLYGACTLLSMLCELSLETVASMPLGRRGSLHLDVKRALLRRDSSVVAPRLDREKGLRWIRRWWRTPVPPEVIAVIAQALRNTPGAQTIGDLLIAEGLNPTGCHRLLNDKRLESRPYESLRVGRSLRNFLLRMGIHPSIVSRALGDISTTPRSHHYYLLLSQCSVHEAINTWCTHIGLKPVSLPQKTVLIGSPKAVGVAQMTAALSAIQQANLSDRVRITTRSSTDEVIGFSNRYVARYALHLLAGEGARCQRLATITCAALFGDAELIWLADRASDRYAQRRACVLTAPQIRGRLLYAEHLRAMAARLEKDGERKVAEQLRGLLSGRQPDHFALPIIFEKKGELQLRCVHRGDLKAVAKVAQMRDLNVPRHFLVTEMVHRKVATVALDAHIGHQQPGAPAFGVGSGLSIAEFARYMRPILETLHADLGYAALQGLGRTSPASLALPRVALPAELAPPQNRYVLQRLDIEDFNPPDLVLAEEDCPLSPLTLVARRKLLEIGRRYLACDAIAKFPAGAVAFSLAVFDSVLSFRDAISFLGRLASGSESEVAGVRVIEAVDANGRPIGQRLLHERTWHALKLARSSGGDWAERALNEAGVLMRELDPDWPDLTPAATMRRLQVMVAHALMVDVSAVSRFCVFHKAPFIPARDLARLAGAYSTEAEVVPPNACRAHRRCANFSDQLGLLRAWTDKDRQVGEYRKRANGVMRDIEQWEATHAADEAQILMNELLRAETGEARPPYRRISLGVLLEYLSLQIPFFQKVRELGRIPVGPEEWEPLVRAFSQGDKTPDGKRRWAALHLGNWLRAKGAPVPREFTDRPVTVRNSAPHLSVYVTRDETAQAAQCIQQSDDTPHAEWFGVSLRLRRCAPMRPEEVRYLKGRHVSGDWRWLHVTTCGHMHLKNIGARARARAGGDTTGGAWTQIASL